MVKASLRAAGVSALTDFNRVSLWSTELFSTYRIKVGLMCLMATTGTEHSSSACSPCDAAGRPGIVAAAGVVNQADGKRFLLSGYFTTPGLHHTTSFTRLLEPPCLSRSILLLRLASDL